MQFFFLHQVVFDLSVCIRRAVSVYVVRVWTADCFVACEIDERLCVAVGLSGFRSALSVIRRAIE